MPWMVNAAAACIAIACGLPSLPNPPAPLASALRVPSPSLAVDVVDDALHVDVVVSARVASTQHSTQASLAPHQDLYVRRSLSRGALGVPILASRVQVVSRACFRSEKVFSIERGAHANTSRRTVMAGEQPHRSPLGFVDGVSTAGRCCLGSHAAGCAARGRRRRRVSVHAVYACRAPLRPTANSRGRAPLPPHFCRLKIFLRNVSKTSHGTSLTVGLSAMISSYARCSYAS